MPFHNWLITWEGEPLSSSQSQGILSKDLVTLLLTLLLTLCVTLDMSLIL